MLGGARPDPRQQRSAGLPETRSDENVFLQIKPSRDSPSGAGSKPSARGASPGGGGGAGAGSTTARARQPTLGPRLLPPALGVGGWSPLPQLPESRAAVPLSSAPLGPPKVFEHPVPLLPVTRGEKPSWVLEERPLGSSPGSARR